MKKPNKFIETIKKKWLIDGTKTFILVLIIIAAFIGINFGMQKLELTPIDLTQEKLYTLTDASKEKVKGINEDVNIYFVGYSNDDSVVDLGKQYKKVNEKIVAEAIDVNERVDIAQKYGIESDTTGIIVECGEKSKVLTSNDLYTYDYSTYETIDVSEEKLTYAIESVTTENIPVVYTLEGYSEFTLTNNMQYLSVYLGNEIMEIKTLNILSTGKVPDDCNALMITTPTKDFDDVAANAIIEYINKGGKILWLNGAYGIEQDLPNVQKVLDVYGVKPFEVGIVMETDSSKMILNSPEMIIPEIQYSDITEKISSSLGVMLIDATRINLKSDEELEQLKVEKTDLLTSSETSFFRNDVTITSQSQTDSDESGIFTLAAQLVKTIKEDDDTSEENTEVKSTLIIIGENYFASDYPISSSSQTPAVTVYNNKDLVINSIAYLTDRENDITVRKSTGTVTYTATEQEDTIVRIIIFAVPIVIIIIGIVIWQVRRRKR